MEGNRLLHLQGISS